ncbi:hypothetical protein C8R48DRAFT_720890 [Suillus tomentosus]|nr:hypothetical protein C8R48DRAFT_720890 [Suillus tomentosus]
MGRCMDQHHQISFRQARKDEAEEEKHSLQLGDPPPSPTNNHRIDLSPNITHPSCLMHDHELLGSTHALYDGFYDQWRYRPGIDRFDAGAA